jgi:hypothetical protein
LLRLPPVGCSPHPLSDLRLQFMMFLVFYVFARYQLSFDSEVVCCKR